MKIHARRSECGDERRRRAGDDRHDECKQQHGAIDARFREARNIRRPERHEDLRGDERERGAGRAANQREHQILREHLPHDARARGAERETDGALARARRDPREEQVRDIRARDKKHETDRAEQQEHRRLHVGHEHVACCRQSRAPPAIALRIRLREPGADRVHLRLRHPEADVGFQPARRDHEPAVARHARHVVLDRAPELGVDVGEMKAWWHDADHVMRPALHHDRLADDSRVAAEEPLPQRVAEHRDLVATGAIVVRLDRASEKRRRAEDAKQAAADARAVDALGQLAARQIERPSGKEAQTLEARSLRAPVLEVRQRSARHRAGCRRAARDEHEQLVGVAKRSDGRAGFCLDDENRRVCADAERQRQDGDRRKTGVLAE